MIDVSKCIHYNNYDCLAHMDYSECCEGYDPAPGYCPNIEDCYYKQLQALKQENKNLTEEKINLNTIIDRLLQHAGFGDSICSAEDFEDVYNDLECMVAQLQALKQEKQQIEELCKKHLAETINLTNRLEKIKEYCIPDLMFTDCMNRILEIIEGEDELN